MKSLYFGIPLRAKAASSDWSLVQTNLRRTVRCLLAQKNASVRVVIAGHDRPKVLDEHIRSGAVTFVNLGRHLPVPTGVEGFNADKKAKKNWLGSIIREMEDEPFYYMHMDADDLLHRRFAETVMRYDNGVGHLIRRGYMVDVASRMIAPADETTTPFYKHCGSCAVVHFTPDELPQRPSSYSSNFSKFGNHGRYVDVARDQGKRLRPFAGHVGAYLVNHGENNRLYRGLGVKKVTFVDRHQIVDATKIRAISGNFLGLDKLMGISRK